MVNFASQVNGEFLNFRKNQTISNKFKQTQTKKSVPSTFHINPKRIPADFQKPFHFGVDYGGAFDAVAHLATCRKL